MKAGGKPETAGPLREHDDEKTTAASAGEHDRGVNPRTRRFFVILAGISVCALLLRIGAGFEMGKTAAVAHPPATTDMATYLRLAEDVRHGRFPRNESAHPREFYYQPLYYTVILPVVHAVFGPDWKGVVLVQALLGAGAVWLTGLIAAMLFGRKAGLWSAVLLAAYRTHIFYTPFRLIAVSGSALFCLWIWLVLRAWRRNTVASWIWAALGISAATLLRGNFVLLMPAVPVLVVYRNRGRMRRGVFLALLTIVLWYLPQLPFSIVNYHSREYWTGPSTAADAVLALGNTPEAPAGGLAYPPVYDEWMKGANVPPGQAWVPVARRILEWMRQEPLAWLELKWRTFLLFWWAEEIPNNVSPAREGAASRIVRFPLLPGFSILGALAVGGMLATLRRHRRSPSRLFLLFCVWGYCVATVLFYMLARFRVPASGVLAVYAGAAVDALWCGVRRWRSEGKGREAVFRTVLYVVFGAVFVNWGYPAYHARLEPVVVRIARPYGVQVRVGKRWRVYDHGPMLLGGWQVVPVGAGGIVVEKRFRLRSETAREHDGTARLRVPLFCPGAVRVRIMVEGDCVPPAGLTADLPGKGLSWVDVSLKGIPRDKPTLTFRIRISGVTEGERLGIACDTARWYGRTSFELPEPMPGLPVGEACVELELEIAPGDAVGHRWIHGDMIVLASRGMSEPARAIVPTGREFRRGTRFRAGNRCSGDRRHRERRGR